ncbi:ABC transporter permease [Rossellomorea marisflavi]|uniref:ABC transporter permease n=1 Tax=Rossellomorea marisflavi TaxID=189381 RepID=UPI0028536FDA|nr:ABC transporter permease [Rossellomorea marisflavi]MDR4935301.1 ABC transporter permease [Rossellomorea marisflavi]
MKSVIKIISELIRNANLMIRLAFYDIKSQYTMHHLGILWQFLNPAIQITVFWLIFGIGFRSGQPVNGFNFFPWFIVGIIPWFFINPSIIQGSNSVFKEIKLVSKMKFPISILPAKSIVGNAFNFLILLIIMVVILYTNGIRPSIYLLQLPYYVFAMLLFIYATTLLFSTFSTMVRDFQQLLSSSMRMLFYLTPILWDASQMPGKLNNLLQLNPFYYIISGFRDTFLYKEWFFDDVITTLYFWFVTLILLYVGSKIHLKFRGKFVDYL